MERDQIQNRFNTKNILLAVGAIAFIIFLFTAGKWFEIVDSSEIVVIQSAFNGKLKVVTTPGPTLQFYGTATHYPRRSQFWFSKHKDEGTETDQSIKIRFNEGGHATISGSVMYYMPLNESAIIKIHRDFQNADNLQAQLIKQVIVKSVYFSGPLMTSKESSAEKRTLLSTYIEDQSKLGIYKTEQIDVKVHDELANTDKTTTIVKIVTNKGKEQRQESSPISKYDVTLDNFTINSIDYDEDVEKQIKVQQQTTMMIQTAIANSKKAEQDAITIELQGKANAAKAKWDQEVLKSQAVTQAQQAKEVAALDAQTAILEAQKQKTKADADYYTNQKLVSAGLTPQQKAEFQKSTAIGVAAELAKIKLPDTYFAGGTGNGNGGASMLESILGVKLLNLPDSK